MESVAYSHKGDLIAGCSWDTVQIFDAAAGVCLAMLEGHNDEVYSIAFSPDDVFIASGSKDTTVKVWDVQTGALVTMLGGHMGTVSSVSFSPTGAMVASGAEDGTVRIWNLSSGACDHILVDNSRTARSVCWFGTSKVISGSTGSVVKVWDVLSGECLSMFGHHADNNQLFPVASSPDFFKIACTSGNYSVISVYDMRTSNILHTIQAQSIIRVLCFSPDGNKIAYATHSSVGILDLVKGVTISTWKFSGWGMNSGSSFLAISPDGDCISVGSRDGVLKVFKMESRNWDDGICDQHSHHVQAVAFAPNGQMVASGSYGSLKLWDTMTCLCTYTCHSPGVFLDNIDLIAFSPDSSLVVSGCQDALRIWNAYASSADAGSSLQNHLKVILMRLIPLHFHQTTGIMV